MQTSPELFSGVNIVSKQPTVMLFYMDGCSHCQQFKPTWNRFAHDSPIAAISFNIGTAPRQLRDRLTAHLVQGVPTIVLYLDGKPYLTYKGARNYEGLMQFANGRANVRGNFEKVGK
jgi:thioredoxin-like negative regulator of GroEL